MNGEVAGSFMFFLFLGSVIIFPIWLRNKLQQKQLDTIATAIEKGVEPERIMASLPSAEKTADVNGNWKSGLILTGLGIVYCVLFAFPVASQEGAKTGAEVAAVFLPGTILIVIGGVLLYIHKSIVGAVVKRGQKVAENGVNGGDAGSS